MRAKVTDIVQSARSADTAAELSRIEEHPLPAEFETLVDEYNEFDDARDPFLWKWIHRLTPQFTFSFVADEHFDTVRCAKTVATMYITLLDDFLEKERDWETFEEAAKIPSPSQSANFDRDAVDTAHLSFAQKVWTTLVEILEAAPHYEAYLDLFLFDTKQAINAIEYSYLLGQYPEIANDQELMNYESHNVMMFSYADVDLMYATDVPKRELPQLRRLVWEAQKMARIGNWIATWERELGENDLSSGPAVYALEQGIIGYDDLALLEVDPDHRHVIGERLRAASVDDVFFERWQRHYERLEAISQGCEVLDVTSYVEGMEEVLRYFVLGTGRV